MREKCTDALHWQARFQEAALDPGQWLTVLAELADATGSARAELIGISGNKSLFDWISNQDPSMFRDFASMDHSPGTSFRVAASVEAPPLSIVHEADYDRVRPRLVNEDYVDFCERHHLPLGCQTTLVQSNGTLIGLSILRSRRDGRTSEAQRRVFGSAIAGALLAVRMQQAIEEQGFHLLRGTLDAMSKACLLLDSRGTVKAVTAAADRILTETASLRLRHGRIGLADGRQERRLDRALRELLSEVGPGQAQVAVHGEGPTPEMVLDLFRLPVREWALPFAPRILLVVRPLRDQGIRGAEILASALGLTKAEAQVAFDLSCGRSREEIAAARAVSLETVRAQVKSLYGKAGCRRESELVLLAKALSDEALPYLGHD